MAVNHLTVEKLIEEGNMLRSQQSNYIEFIIQHGNN
jgi:hypothetical protein